ncbi:MAG TPA: hypothetical protein VEL07_11945 [Planctomycetota bacterium]|nr:hypothetical protein [Planctomycetota bacterium]
MPTPQETEPRMPDAVERQDFHDQVDTPVGGSLAAAHHHPPVSTELERGASHQRHLGVAAMDAGGIPAAAAAWTAEQVLAAKRDEQAGANRRDVLDELDRQLASRITGAAPSSTPPA